MLVRSTCPISGVPIWMGLLSTAEHEAQKERRMREDAERLQMRMGEHPLKVSPEFLQTKLRY